MLVVFLAFFFATANDSLAAEFAELGRDHCPAAVLTGVFVIFQINHDPVLVSSQLMGMSCIGIKRRVVQVASFGMQDR